MKPRSKTALKKQWPGKFIVQALFITEEGSEIQLEADLPKDIFTDVLGKILKHMTKKEDIPVQLGKKTVQVKG